MDELLQQFLIEGRELVIATQEALQSLRSDSADREAIDAGFRAVHTLKGSVAIFDMAPAGRLLHEAESILERARAGTATIGESTLASVIASIDRVDAWIDAMGSEGELPADAAAVADRLLGSPVESVPVAVEDSDARPDWLAALVEREAASLRSTQSNLVAIRYQPDAECLFRGDDPLALIAALPDLQALHIPPVEPPRRLEELEPFQSYLVFEALSGASIDTLRTHFRLVSDQVDLQRLHARAERDTPVGEAQTQTLRVDMRRIDALADSVGELIVAATALEPLVAEIARVEPALGARLRVAHANVERETLTLQRGVLAVRSVAIAPMVRRLPRIVRDLGMDLAKEIDFAIEGDGIEVDKAIADSLYEPLLHLVRNAVDHGIEPASEREAIGKPRAGRLRLLFRRIGGQLDVTLTDDGRGIDPERVRSAAVSRGILSPDQAASLDDRASIDLIFSPGFSSAATVTAVSGRGVGMDAVRSALDRVGARIDVETQAAVGTTMRLAFPLHAITTRMLVIHAGPDRYAIPFDRVIETTIVPASAVVPLGGGEALVLRERSVPLLHLTELLGGDRQPARDLRLMVSQHGAEQIALAVDGFGQQISATVRAATGLLASIPGVAGTTVLGDGEVLIVIDPERLVG